MTLAELSDYFIKQNGSVPAGLEELYGRLNWEYISDLTVDRLAERMEMQTGSESQDAAADQ